MTTDKAVAKEIVDEYTPWSVLLNRTYAQSLGIVSLAVWLHAADSLIVATMLPKIVEEIGGLNLISWVVMLYEVGSIVAGAASGLLLAQHGIKHPMIIAAALFSIGCGIGALASTMPIFLWGRLLQGLGGGGLMAMSFVAITMLFEPRLRARAMGVVSTVWAASAFLGPLIGGLFVEFVTWQAAFWLFGAMAAALALWLSGLTVAQDAAPQKRDAFPGGRLCLLLGGIMAIAFAGEDVDPVKSPLFIGLGIVLIAQFLRADARSDGNNLLPRLDILARDPASAALLMIFCLAAGTIAIGSFAAFFLVTIHGFSPLAAGYMIAIEAVAWAGTAAIVSGQPERRDRITIAIGASLVVLSTLFFALSIASGPIWLFVLAVLMQGAGFGAAWTFIPRLATQRTTQADAALISAAIPTTQRIGYAVGAAYLGIVANIAGMEDGLLSNAAAAVFAAELPLAALSLFALWRFTRPYRGKGMA